MFRNLGTLARNEGRLEIETLSAMPLSAGHRLGPYEVIALLGTVAWAGCIEPAIRTSAATSR